MILERYTKQPADRLDYDLEYRDWLSTGDSLASATATVSPTETGGLSLDTPLIDGTRVKIFADEGLNGSLYKVTVTTTTTAGRIKQDEFTVRVKDY